MQMGAVELHGVHDESRLNAWTERVKRYFSAHHGGCSLHVPPARHDPALLFFNLPDGEEALGGFISHMEESGPPGALRFCRQDEDGTLQPLER